MIGHFARRGRALRLARAAACGGGCGAGTAEAREGPSLAACPPMPRGLYSYVSRPIILLQWTICGHPGAMRM